MTLVEAAARLGIPEHWVRSVTEHSAGWLVDVKAGPTMLVSATTARVYLPEVDDPVPEPEVVAEPKKAAVKKAAPKAKGA